MEDFQFDVKTFDEVVDEEKGVRYRRLRRGDLDEGYFELLGQLTKANFPESHEALDERFSLLDGNCDTVVVVAEDLDTGVVCGTSTLFLERKFIRNLGVVGHIEDVVLDSSFRGRGAGSKMIQILNSIARNSGAYKVILDCSEDNVDFYKKNGYSVKGAQMGLYF